MNIRDNAPLHTHTSFNVGGNANRLITVESGDSVADALTHHKEADPLWVLGYGTNVLISDQGLPGTTLLLRNDHISVDGTRISVDAGAWWDDVVRTAGENKLWGIELMSGIPGSVGAGVFININAYGQGMSDVIEWVEAWDPQAHTSRRFASSQLTWEYKQSIFQRQEHAHLIITRVGLLLHRTQTTPLAYQSALDVAHELALDPDNLADRRRIVLKARDRAESIFIPGQGHSRTIGSFFKNPLVDAEKAERVIAFDETGKSREQIAKMNVVHGGDARRISAAHVMLAAGFFRGQAWGDVRLHHGHILKIENTGSASAQDIYDASTHIVATVKDKLDIVLEPEARILGEFLK